ncbi:MAG: DoxX family protein [Nocardioidaceae bacterium]
MTAHRGPAEPPHVAGAAWALSVLLLTTGGWHFASPTGFESIVPGFLGSPPFWVHASGVAELSCAVSLAIRPTRRVAGWACVVLFVVLYPANIKMALDSLDGDGGALIAWLRLPLQIPLVLWALYIARSTRPRARRPEAELTGGT